jgi:hypothetical protein
MRIIKSFKLFGIKLNENIHRPYVNSLESLESYKKFSEWADIKLEQSQDGKNTKVTVYPDGKDSTILKYELRESNILKSGDRIKIGLYQFKDFQWEYIMGYSVSKVSDYNSIFSGIEKIILRDLYGVDISYRKFLSSPENLEPVENSENPKLMLSLISRIPEWKVVSYFKQNPTSIYMLNNSPELKKKIMYKANIGDYSKIGRVLKNGLI